MARETATDRVARLLREDIQAGRLRDGQVLPGTRELAAEYGVSNATVSRAFDQLAVDGLLEQRPKSRAVVRAAHLTARTLRTHHTVAVLVGGYAGSGKSELSRVLANHTGWSVIDKDTVSRPLVESLLEQLGRPPHDRESQTYLDHVRPLEYECLNDTIRENLECGANVIATAPYLREFNNPQWVAEMRADAESLGATLALVWVRADLDSMRLYIRRRGAARDAEKLADWGTYARGVDLKYRPAGPHHVVQNGAGAPDLRQQAEALASRIQAEAAL